MDFLVAAQRRGSIFAYHPAPEVQFSTFPKIYFVDGEIKQRGWLEESGQRLDNVERTHLVLASKNNKKHYGTVFRIRLFQTKRKH